MTPPPQELAPVQELYDRGLCLQAYELALGFGPLRLWEGTSARILAGRLALNLGAPRLGRAMHARAFRDDPSNPEAIYYFGFERVSRGPLVAWEYLVKHGDLTNAPQRLRADEEFEKAKNGLIAASQAAQQRKEEEKKNLRDFGVGGGGESF